MGAAGDRVGRGFALHPGLRAIAAFITAAAGALAVAAPAHGELAVGVLEGPGNALVTFDTSTPHQFGPVLPISGLQAGEDIVGIDYRYFPIGETATPAGLFGLGIVDAGATDTARLYRIDQGTGAATAVGSPITAVDDGSDYGVDFNPKSDRLRVVSDADENMRINPNNGVRSDNTDTNLNPASADIEAVAYDRIDADAGTPTTLFALNTFDASLSMIGGVDDMPSANFGIVGSVGPTGVLTSAAGARNLDISPGGAAYATVVTSSTLSPDLYGVNLATGGATLVGSLPAALRGFAIAPRASMQFDRASAQVSEGDVASLTVVRTVATSATATVEFRMDSGSASGADYATSAGTLTFAPGETSKTIAVTTTSDSAEEPDETLTVSLTDPGPTAETGAPDTLELTIVDDDGACAKAKAKLKKAKKKLRELKAGDGSERAIAKAAKKVKKLKKKVKQACK